MQQFALVLFLLTSTPENLTQQPVSSYGIISPATEMASSFSDRTFSDLKEQTFEESLEGLYVNIDLQRYNLSYEVFRYGMIGYYTLQQQGKLSDKNLLTIIDFTKPSTERRFYTIDLKNQRVVYHTYVSHGKNTGQDMAQSFSNRVHSNQSSLGFYVTGETYVGSKGYSLKLDGMEKGYNDKLRERAVVVHEADYVSESWIRKYGRLGRSQGCPALPQELSRKIINTIKDKTAIFAYYNDSNYLTASRYLKADELENRMNSIASHEAGTIVSGTN